MADNIASELATLAPSGPGHVEPKHANPDEHDIAHIERVISPDADNDNADDNLKDHMDLSRMDKEVQQYASLGHIEVDEATNRRLLRKIDRRVLTFMIITYFLQAIDKGTLAFTSIMDLPADTGLVGQQVCFCIHGFSSSQSFLFNLLICTLKNDSTPGLQRASTLLC